MTSKYFALDTNILIYLEGTDRNKRQTAESLLSFNPVIPSQVVSEFINVTRRLRNIPKHQLIKEAADLFRYCLIAPTYHSTLNLAENLIQKYDLQIFDSLVVASALEAECTILYSEDMQHGLIINKRMKIINPFIFE